jgi:acyl-coenzyme A synthetase/AMP-(fatty) acid ligase
MYLLYITMAALASYVLFALYKMGYYSRIPLAFSRISLEQVPVKAAARYGDAPLFETDLPVTWCVPQLANQYPEKDKWTAKQIDTTAGYLAAMLQEQAGIKIGDRVAIIKRNHFDIQLLMISAVRAGGIACPMNEDFVADKVEPYVRNIGARILVADKRTILRLMTEDAQLALVHTIIFAESKDTLSEKSILDLEQSVYAAFPRVKKLIWIEEGVNMVAAPVGPVKRGKSEPLYLTHSSGTTGFPKSVILTNEGQSHAARGMVAYSVVAKKDRAYVLVPFNHQACLTTLNTALIAGVKTYWASKTKFDFNAKETLATLQNGKFAAFFSFPFAYIQMAGEPLEKYDLKSMKVWGCTADVCHEVLQRKFAQIGSFFTSIGLPIKGSVFCDAQGSSEVGTPSTMRYVTTLTRNFDRRVGRWGSVPLGPRIKVLKRDGTPAKLGEIGRLYVKGKTVTPGYWNNHEKTYSEHRDKWFFTGDIVKRHHDGNLIQLDREVDIIQGKNGEVYSLLIEEEIHKHAAIYDCCVYGARQQDGFQRPAVAVALRDGYKISEAQLLNELNMSLDPSQKLCQLEIIPYTSFPLGVTGKTLKRAFRDKIEKTEELNRPIFA